MDGPAGVAAPGDIVVVGAGVSGVRFAQALRRGGYEAGVTLINPEREVPYDRPPLSKDMLKGAKELDAIRLCTAEELAESRIGLLSGAPAVRLDRTAKEIVLAGGRRVPYDTLVIATGVRPDRLPPSLTSRTVHSVSTATDTRELRGALVGARHVAIVGAGFIGSEVAATAREQGCDVTLIGRSQHPLGRLAGDWVGERVARMHAEHGVAVRMGTQVVSIVDDNESARLHLSDGSWVEADVIVAGVGSSPNTEWLDGSGLEVSDGVIVDAHGRSADDPSIWAMGDVARHRGEDGSTWRHEHWTHATDGAAALARLFTGKPPSPIPPVDYVWSDLYGSRLQMFGGIADGAVPSVLIDEPGRFLIAYTVDGGLVAMIGYGVSAKFMRFRGPVALGGRLEDVLEHV